MLVYFGSHPLYRALIFGLSFWGVFPKHFVEGYLSSQLFFFPLGRQTPRELCWGWQSSRQINPLWKLLNSSLQSFIITFLTMWNHCFTECSTGFMMKWLYLIQISVAVSVCTWVRSSFCFCNLRNSSHFDMCQKDIYSLFASYTSKANSYQEAGNTAYLIHGELLSHKFLTKKLHSAKKNYIR